MADGSLTGLWAGRSAGPVDLASHVVSPCGLDFSLGYKKDCLKSEHSKKPSRKLLVFFRLTEAVLKSLRVLSLLCAVVQSKSCQFQGVENLTPSLDGVMVRSRHRRRCLNET